MTALLQRNITGRPYGAGGTIELDAVSKIFGKQIQELKVEMKAPQARVSVMEEVIVVPAQTESNRLRTAGGAGLGVFAAVLFAVAFLEFRARRVGSVEEVTQGLKMRLRRSLQAPSRARPARSWHRCR